MSTGIVLDIMIWVLSHSLFVCFCASLSVEFTHEMSCLPRPPEILRKDSPNSWHYNHSTLGRNEMYNPLSAKDPFTFLTNLTGDEEEECDSFEMQFKRFMYGGVSVQRLLPNSDSVRTRKERRTLWLMLPEVGSLRLGFVSKLSDGEGTVSNKNSTQRVKRDTCDHSLNGWEGDLGTVASEEVTLDSALLDKVRLFWWAVSLRYFKKFVSREPFVVCCRRCPPETFVQEMFNSPTSTPWHSPM